ncbi:MAG: FHA domain-containing protein [Verrucomicrobiota bacterium]
MPRLVILSEGLTGKAHELKVEKTTIGRVEDNIFQIPEASISSHHCEILLRGQEVVVHDLNSTNGTFVNGQQVTGEAVLKPGQIVRFGQVELRLEDPGAKPATATKKLPDQTMILPQGVKLGTDTATATFSKEKPGFAKKSNTGTKIFIGAVVVVAAAVIVAIIRLLQK